MWQRPKMLASSRLFRSYGIGITALLGMFCCGAALDFGVPQSRPPKIDRDRLGQATKLDTGLGWVKSYERTPDGLLAKLSYARRGMWSGLELPASRRVRWEHDPGGRRTLLDDESGRTTFSFNAFNLPSAVTYPDGSHLGYEYDPWGQVSRIRLPNDRELRFIRATTGSVLRVNAGDTSVEYRYDEARRELTRSISHVLVSTFLEDEAGRLVRIRHAHANGTLILELGYTRDAWGRVVRVDEHRPGARRTTEYQYDPLGRLSKSGRAGDWTEYGYDGEGNRTFIRDRSGTIHYEYRDGKLVQAGDVSYEHDQLGRLITKQERQGSSKYVWGLESELSGAKTPRGAVDYVYNGEMLRTKRITRSGSTSYLHNATDPLLSVIAEKDEHGSSHDIFGNTRVGRRLADGSLRFFLEDHLGSTRIMVDGSGDEVASYDYSDFGVPTRSSGTEDAPYLYAGEAWDTATELLYLRHRYYDPRIGRFLSPDPNPPSLTNPQSINRYAYCEGDPINRVDPLGLQPVPPNYYYDYLHRLYPSWQLFPPYVPPPVYEPYVPPRPYDLTQRWMFEPPSARFVPPPILYQPPQPVVRPVQSEIERYSLDAVQLILGFGAALAPPPINVCLGVACGAISAYEAHRYGPGSVGLEATKTGFGTFLDFHDTGLANPTARLVGRWAPLVSAAGILEDVSPEVWSYTPAVLSWHTNVGQALFSPLNPARVVGPAVAAAQNLLQTQRSADWLGRAGGLEPVVAGELNRTRNLFFPPPPGSGGIPAVGGVYLDQSARILGELGTITGAVFDPQSGRLVLIGDKDRTSPAMKPALLAAAIRAVYSPAKEDPGMTIDPNPADPHSDTMLVRFFAHTENTELGNIMFLTDRRLKGYSVGRDNLTSAVVESQVPGYQSMAARSLMNHSEQTGLWSRFWITPHPITARVDGSAIIFDPIRMRVQTETMRWADGKLVPAGNVRDPDAEAFASHFSQHYDEFLHPEFQAVKQVTQAVALAKWLKERGVPADWGFVNSVLREPFPTPTTTPAAHNELEQVEGNGRRRIRVFGGVEMQPVIEARTAPEVARVKEQALAANSLAVMPIKIDGRMHVAAALTEPTRALHTFDSNISDLNLPAWAAELAQLPGLSRRYTSTDNAVSEFGRGWSLSVPRLEFESDADALPRTIRMLSFEGFAPVQAQGFALVDGGTIVRFDKAFPDRELSRIGFAPTTNADFYRGLFPEGDGLYRLLFTNGSQALFDRNGLLRAAFVGDGKGLYDYRGDGRLLSIDLQRGARQIRVAFGRSDEGRITDITAGGERASFEYSPAGDLVSARNQDRTIGYRYDDHHRPIRIEGQGNVTTLRYDDAGRVLEYKDGVGPAQHQSVTATPDGLLARREIDGIEERRNFDRNGRLVCVEGPVGKTELSYAQEGYLSELTTTLRGGGQRTATFARDGAPLSVRDPSGTQTEWRYLPDQRISEIVIDGQTFARFDHDATGLRAVYYAGGYEEHLERNNQQQPIRIRRVQPSASPEEAALNVVSTARQPSERPRVSEDTDGRPQRIETAQGTAILDYGPGGKIRRLDLLQATRQTVEFEESSVTVTTLAGKAKYLFDERDRLSGVEDVLGNLTHYTLGSNGEVSRIVLPGGRVVVCEAERILPVECLGIHP